MNNTNKEYVQFKDLDVGDVFKYVDGFLYMKTQKASLSIIGAPINSVMLEKNLEHLNRQDRGMLFYFDEDEFVKPLDACFVTGINVK